MQSDFIQSEERDNIARNSRTLKTPPAISGRKAFGLMIRKERWGLSLRGWLVVLCGLLVTTFVLILGIYPFLAVTGRVEGEVLVVEGWVHDYAVRRAVDEFRSGGYSRIFTTGGPVEGMGGYSNDYNTAASVGASRLRAAGIPGELVQMVPCRIADRDRTYNSAVALRQWLHDHNVPMHRMNIVTEDAHARRSRLLFQKAFGKDVKVGIISIPSPDYDATHWWRYSEGVREIIGEGLGYLYARFCFHSGD